MQLLIDLNEGIITPLGCESDCNCCCESGKDNTKIDPVLYILSGLIGLEPLKIVESRRKIEDTLSVFDNLTKINILLVIVDRLLQNNTKEEKTEILKPFLNTLGM